MNKVKGTLQMNKVRDASRWKGFVHVRNVHVRNVHVKNEMLLVLQRQRHVLSSKEWHSWHSHLFHTAFQGTKRSKMAKEAFLTRTKEKPSLSHPSL